MVKTESDDSAT